MCRVLPKGFSEAQFKILNYQSDFPDRFGSTEEARTFMVDFFRRYSAEHHYTDIA